MCGTSFTSCTKLRLMRFMACCHDPRFLISFLRVSLNVKEIQMVHGLLDWPLLIRLTYTRIYRDPLVAYIILISWALCHRMAQSSRVFGDDIYMQPRVRLHSTSMKDMLIRLGVGNQVAHFIFEKAHLHKAVIYNI